MKTFVFAALALSIGGLSAYGLLTVSPKDISNFSAIVINTCSPVCPQEATCIANKCVFPKGSGNEEVPGDNSETPVSENPKEADCSENPEWTTKKGKNTVCHIIKASLGLKETRIVSSNSLLTHISHGDKCGPCSVEPISDICSPNCSQRDSCVAGVCISPEDQNCIANPEWINHKGKINICHKTGNYRKPWKSINISSSALPAHINHGDMCGPCETINQNPSCDNNCEEEHCEEEEKREHHENDDNCYHDEEDEDDDKSHQAEEREESLYFWD